MRNKNITMPDAATGEKLAAEITDKKGFAARWLFSRRQVDNFLRQGMPYCAVGKRRVRIVICEADAWMKARFGTRRFGRAAVPKDKASPEQPATEGGER